MRNIKRTTLFMSSGRKINFDEIATKEFLELINLDGEIKDMKPIVINNEFKVTTNIIYPEHITEIVFD